MRSTVPCREVDWGRVWDHRLLTHRERNGGRDSAQKWKGREPALRYWRNACEFQQGRIEMTIRGLAADSGSCVLDIGSGPGVLAIPLARRVAHVTAVDAAAGMIEVLEEKAREQGLSNIRCVPKRWEEVDVPRDLVPPYDVVLASLCLDMLDIRAAISKMQQVCSRHLYLFWFAGEPSWEVLDRTLFPCVQGIHYAALPKCELLIRVLRQMGIRPDIAILPYVHVDRFATLDEAVEHFRRRYAVPPGAQGEAIRACLSGRLRREGDALVLRSRATCLRLHWETGQARKRTS